MKVIMVDKVEDLQYLCESEGTMAQIKINENTTETYKRISGEWVKVQIYNG